MVIPSVFLWRRAVQDLQANAPFQKLRRNLLLLLQLAVLTALLGGVASPYFMAQRLSGKSTVLVIDASASMQATDVGGSRLEEAKRLAAAVVKGMGRRDEAALVVCEAQVRVGLPFSRDRRRLLAALKQVQPTDCPTNMRDGLLLALSLVGKRPQARVYLISDGAFPPLPEVPSSAEVRFMCIGRSNDNVALLAFEVGREPGAQKRDTFQVFLRMKNYSPEEKQGVVSIYYEEDLLDAHKVELRPREDRVETYNLVLTKPGLLRAEMEVTDDLKADNVAYTFAEPTSAVSVLLVTAGNLFLEQGLLVLPGINVHKTTSLSAAEAAKAYQEYDLVVFDRVSAPSQPAAGGLLLIDAEDSGGPASLGAELSSPRITHWEEQHPVLHYVNLAAAQISRGHALQAAVGAKVLAWAGEQPVIVAQEKAELRMLAFGWNFLDSDLPLRVGFPVLLSNSIQWLAQARGAARPMTVRPGGSLRFSAPPEATVAEAILPDGQRRQVPVVNGEVAFLDTDRVGVYRMKAADRQWRWAVDMRSDEESNISPDKEVKLGARSVQAGTGPPRVEYQLWPYLILFALAVLLGEWHLYHRRY